jgi:hypothetical protein
MRITIAERLRPYSHSPGVSCILPGSSYQVQIFPCLIRFYNLSRLNSPLIGEVSLQLKGPVQKFTVLNDLEKGWITVFGHTSTGFIRYHLYSQKHGKEIGLFIEKAPEEGLEIFFQENAFIAYQQPTKKVFVEATLKPKDTIAFHFLPSKDSSFHPYQASASHRLSLGNHKAQDWDLIKRRLDLKEIFPIWNRLGQLVPYLNEQPIYEGTACLLRECEDLIAQGKPEFIAQSFLSLFQAGFHDILVPRLIDDQYQGISSVTRSSSTYSPLSLLIEGAHLINRLFIQEDKEGIWILPVLLPEFHSGRLLQFKVKEGLVDLEWSKKTIRRMIFYSETDKELVFHFKKSLKSYRLRQGTKDKGHMHSTDSSIFIQKNCYYFFDNFE